MKTENNMNYKLFVPLMAIVCLLFTACDKDDVLPGEPMLLTHEILTPEGEKRYRIVPLDMLEKSMSIQPKSNLVLVPEKGIFVFAEILIPELVNSLDDEKSLQDTFDQYCAGRLWEHNSYIKNVDKISNLCNVPF